MKIRIAQMLFMWFLLFISCSSESKKEEDATSFLNSEDGGDFRGNIIGDDIHEVMARESEHIVYSMPDQLTCRIPATFKDSTFYEVNYNFNEKGLYVIALEVFPPDSSTGNQLYREFSDFYNNLHGTKAVKNDLDAWSAFSSNGRQIEITMQRHYEDPDKPRLSIFFFEN